MIKTIHPEEKVANHVLYSNGGLVSRADLDYDDVLEKLASTMRRTTDQIKERLLSGKRKKIKSSDSLEKLFRLKSKLEAIGLDVYIELDTSFDIIHERNSAKG